MLLRLRLHLHVQTRYQQRPLSRDHGSQPPSDDDAGIQVRHHEMLRSRGPSAQSAIFYVVIVRRLTSIYVRLFRCTAATHRRSSNRTCHTPLRSVSRSRTQSPFLTFHIFKVRSDPEITFCPSCWKQVMAPVCADNVALQAPFSGSQMRRVLSAAAETSRS